MVDAVILRRASHRPQKNSCDLLPSVSPALASLSSDSWLDELSNNTKHSAVLSIKDLKYFVFNFEIDFLITKLWSLKNYCRILKVVETFHYSLNGRKPWILTNEVNISNTWHRHWWSWCVFLDIFNAPLNYILKKKLYRIHLSSQGGKGRQLGNKLLLSKIFVRCICICKKNIGKIDYEKTAP